MVYKKWDIHTPNAIKSAALQQALGEEKLLCDVLVSRGIETPEAVGAFLNEKTPLPGPMGIRDMDKAVERIRRALEEDEPMVIFGDYDVDGITATTLLYTYLESLGASVFYKLPSRSVDEYGLTPAIVDQVYNHDISLLITVDNGTSAQEAALRAKELGVDIVMTDHHLPPDELPDVCALVNPCREDDDSGCENLSGVGVAFMLVSALEGCLPEEMLPLFGDLVAVGTVADVMSLTGPNRTLVREGLAVLQDTQRPGLIALINNCGQKDKPITVENISFILAPRLNAAGRMDDATDALRLFLAESEEEALPLVDCLVQCNEARQRSEQEILAAIVQQVDEDETLRGSRVLVVWGEGWHQGVIGIVASRLVERYAKPAVVISVEGEDGRGSGRSVAGFSLYGAVASCADFLIRYGGHNLAAGLSVHRDYLVQLRERINRWAIENYPNSPSPELSADMMISLNTLTLEQVRSLDKLAPCGSGNPLPRFCLQDAVVDAVYPVGEEGRHSRLRLRQGDNTLYAVFFGTGPAQLVYSPGDKVDALLSLSIYEGRFEPRISARVNELRPAGMGNEHVTQSVLFTNFTTGSVPTGEQKALLAPTREDTAAVYRAIRDGQSVFYGDMRPVFARFGEELTGRILMALAALEELELIERDLDSGKYRIRSVTGKKDLGASAILKRLEV